jgi:hypothetical protein
VTAPRSDNGSSSLPTAVAEPVLGSIATTAFVEAL